MDDPFASALIAISTASATALVAPVETIMTPSIARTNPSALRESLNVARPNL